MVHVIPDDQVILHRHHQLGNDYLELVEAPPRAYFAAELLVQIRQGKAMPEIYIDKVEVGGTLKIKARNRSAVYRLVEFVDSQKIFVGEWPD